MQNFQSPIPFKKLKTFITNGDINNWNALKESIPGITNFNQNKILDKIPAIL